MIKQWAAKLVGESENYWVRPVGGAEGITIEGKRGRCVGGGEKKMGRVFVGGWAEIHSMKQKGRYAPKRGSMGKLKCEAKKIERPKKLDLKGGHQERLKKKQSTGGKNP